MSSLEHTVYAKIFVAIAEAIESLGTVPSGHLYAQLMSYMSLDTYNQIINDLVGLKMVELSNNQLRWLGRPK